jgi:dihydropyrimidine dehydrogenase (NAD+) subunit PreT
MASSMDASGYRPTGDAPSFVQQATVSPENAARFPDLHPALDRQSAIPEANRCLFCFDAPCASACPTHIDVPRFIKKIASGNLAGSARTILDANILGASCARACPVEVLCEGACVLHRYNKQPIQIGRLQRFAMDSLHASGATLPFSPAADTGLSVALIGAGPASLACAAELRRRGIRAHLFDARALPGGLSTYGVAEYKLPLVESLREIEMLAQLGVHFHFNTPVDSAMLAALEQEHDAIFLGIGLGAIHQLGIAGEELTGVTNALDLIAGYKSGELTQAPPNVVVIGAGNTAIDAAIAAVRLGATDVHIVYRRGEEQMSAFRFEYEHARLEGVKFLWHVQPTRILGDLVGEAEQLGLIRLAPTEDGALVPQPDTEFYLPADMIVLAIGQATQTSWLSTLGTGMGDGTNKLQLERGRIVINRATGQTSQPKYFAGGDCTNGGREVVDAVADGKRAGIGIAAALQANLEAKHATA